MYVNKPISIIFSIISQKYIGKHNPIHQEALIDNHSFPKKQTLAIMILCNIEQINRQIDGLLKIEILFQNVMNEKEKFISYVMHTKEVLKNVESKL